MVLNMVTKRRVYRVIGFFVLLLVVLVALGIGWGLQSQSFAEDATDLYFKTSGKIGRASCRERVLWYV